MDMAGTAMGTWWGWCGWHGRPVENVVFFFLFFRKSAPVPTPLNFHKEQHAILGSTSVLSSTTKKYSEVLYCMPCYHSSIAYAHICITYLLFPNRHRQAEKTFAVNLPQNSIAILKIQVLILVFRVIISVWTPLLEKKSKNG